LSRITKGVKNGDDDRLGQGIEVSHLSCIAYVTGVIDEKDEKAHMTPDDTTSSAPC